MVSDDEFRAFYRDRESIFLADWFELLRIPSISADSAHTEDCRACAHQLTRLLAESGFRAAGIETGSKPLVFAERPGECPGPTVLLYGHYDVQPVDPLALWETPPFEPVMRNGRCYARGAQDNKGQLMYVLAALRALIALEVPLPPLKLAIEGEEENASAGMARVMAAEPERFKADFLLVHDTSMAPSGHPAITLGLRGIVQLTATLHGPSHDLHSGLHGGLAPNPAQEIARLLAGLHTSTGRIALPGYYDAVRPPSPDDLALAEATPFDPEGYQTATGCLPQTGGPSAAMRVGFLPSLDINGLFGGYQGAGVKTIIPARATVKLSARIVPDQDPETILAMIEAYLHRATPAGLRLEIEERGVAGPGFRLDSNSPLVTLARDALARDGRPVHFRWEGASIPIVSALAQVAGAEPLLVGFGLESDCIHAPNESFSIDRFQQGYMYICRLLQAIGSRHGKTT